MGTEQIIKETLEKQLALLSERSGDADVTAMELCNLTRAMNEVIEAMRYCGQSGKRLTDHNYLTGE